MGAGTHADERVVGPSRKLWVNGAIAATLLAVWGVLSLGFQAQQGDFAAFYTGAAIARSGDFHHLHDAARQTAIERVIVPQRPDATFFVRPDIYAALLTPLALLPFRAAFAAWIAAQMLVLAACCWWAGRRFGPDALPLAGLFPLTVMSAAFGQDAVFYLGVLVAAWWLHERGRPLQSGLVLGLVLLKPHLAFLLPVAMLMQRRWRMLGGFALTAAAEAVGTFALAGPSGVASYLRFLHDRAGYLSPHPERMLNTASVLLNLGCTSAAAGVLLLLVAGAAILLAMMGPWWRALSAAVIGALVIAPHTIPYDAAWAILPAWLAYFCSRHPAVRAAAVLFFIPVPWLLQLLDKPWTIAPALVVLALLLAMAWEGICEARPVVVALPAQGTQASST
jgi:hypothetical protein